MSQQGNKPQVLRGGCWFNDSEHCRSAYRISYPPSYRFNYLGFRVLRSSEADNKPQVLRGGSWYINSEYCRSASRSWSPPDFRVNYLGFRVLRSFNNLQLKEMK